MDKAGTCVADEGVYKVILPLEGATIVLDYQTLFPNIGLNSRAAFTSLFIMRLSLLANFFSMTMKWIPSAGRVVRLRRETLEDRSV